MKKRRAGGDGQVVYHEHACGRRAGSRALYPFAKVEVIVSVARCLLRGAARPQVIVAKADVLSFSFEHLRICSSPRTQLSSNARTVNCSSLTILDYRPGLLGFRPG